MAQARTSNSSSEAAGEMLARLRRLHVAVRFALPQRHAILVIVLLVLAVAGINAFEPLVLKGVFDQLTDRNMPGPSSPASCCCSASRWPARRWMAFPTG
ncbi:MULTISPECIES: hypothetical protein [unclassified Bradyrhizobium]|uniref:hypothetical protein n=1 Tax=unclassified Bradyrhizobium TaxID=2631580 RepID=UPI0028F10100|nr:MULTISPECIES: hypothetical protein [unclassified Bradyrhizobium]